MIRRILDCYQPEDSELYTARLGIFGVGDIDAALDSISLVGGVVTDVEPTRPGVFEVRGELQGVEKIEDIARFVQMGWEWGPVPDISYVDTIRLSLGDDEQVVTVRLPSEFAIHVFGNIAQNLRATEAKNPVF